MPNTNQETQTINTNTQQQAQTTQQTTQQLQPIQETLNQLNLFNYSQKIKNLQTKAIFVNPQSLQYIIQTKVTINSLYNVLGMLDCIITTNTPTNPNPSLRLSKTEKKAIIKKINTQDYRPTTAEYEAINRYINNLKEKSKTNTNTLSDTFNRVIDYFSQEDISLQDINCIIKYCLLPDLNTLVSSNNLSYFFNGEIARELSEGRTSNSSFYNPLSVSSSVSSVSGGVNLVLREEATEPRAVVIHGYVTTDLPETGGTGFTDSVNKERIYSTLSSRYSNSIHKYSFTNTKQTIESSLTNRFDPYGDLDSTLDSTQDSIQEDTLEERVKQESLNNPTLRLIPVKFAPRANAFTPIKPDYTEIIRNSCSGGSGSSMYSVSGSVFGDDSFIKVISLDNRTCELFTKEQFSRIDKLYSDKEEGILAIKNLMKELLTGMCNELFDLESLCGIQSKKRLEDLLKDKETRRVKTPQEEAIYFSNGSSIRPINSSTSSSTSSATNTTSSNAIVSSRARNIDRWYTAYPSTSSFDNSLMVTEPTIEDFREHYMVADEEAFSSTQSTSPSTSPNPQSEPVELTDEDLVYNPYTDPRRTSHHRAQDNQQSQSSHTNINDEDRENDGTTNNITYTPNTIREMLNEINAVNVTTITSSEINRVVEEINAIPNNTTLETSDVVDILFRTLNFDDNSNLDNISYTFDSSTVELRESGFEELAEDIELLRHLRGRLNSSPNTSHRTW